MKLLSISTLCVFLFVAHSSTYSQTLVVKAAQMLDVRKGVMITPAVIVIKEGIIEEINPKQLPGGTEIIDLGNKTILPGLIDMHVHLASGDSDYLFSSLVTESATHVTIRSVRNAQRDLFSRLYHPESSWAGPSIAGVD
jgi:imidazolonepropionase-like amidohydrolase